MNILAIDTSNELLGVAIQKNGKLIGEKMTNIKKDHSSRLMPAIVSLMEEVQVDVEQLDKIVVAEGPGSYTGVRIGVTTAKTMAWALDIPVIPLSSLRALAYNGLFFNGYIWTFFNARRNAVFTALYQFESGKLKKILEEQYSPFDDWLKTLQQFSNEQILVLSPHIDLFRERIEEERNDRMVILDHHIHFLRPANLIYASEHSDSQEVHLVKPNYLRMTEAEANLLKRQEK